MAESRRGMLKRLGAKPILYFVQAEQVAIKIGITMDMGDRMKTLQVGCPLELTLLGIVPDDDAEALERRLQYRWREHRLRGEWFRLAPEITGYIINHALEHNAWAEAQVLGALGATYGGSYVTAPRPAPRPCTDPPAPSLEALERMARRPRYRGPSLGTGRKARLAEYKAARGLSPAPGRG